MQHMGRKGEGGGGRIGMQRGMACDEARAGAAPHHAAPRSCCAVPALPCLAHLFGLVLLLHRLLQAVDQLGLFACHRQPALLELVLQLCHL